MRSRSKLESSIPLSFPFDHSLPPALPRTTNANENRLRPHLHYLIQWTCLPKTLRRGQPLPAAPRLPRSPPPSPPAVLSSISSLASSWHSKTSRAGETQDFGVDEGSGTENTSWKWRRRREASQDGDRCVERDDRLRQGAYVAVRRFIPVRRSLDIRARYQLHGPERKGRGPVAAGSSEKASPRPFTEPVHSN